MYQVYVESGRIDDEVDLDHVAEALATNLEVIGRGATSESTSSRAP